MRENANVFVWFARFLDLKAYENSAAAISESMREIVDQPEILMLSPTVRSLL